MSETYGRFIKVEDLHRSDSYGHRLWRCVCECGVVSVKAASSVKSGRTTSCGCYGGGKQQRENARHGHARKSKITSEYRIWCGMKGRCNNPKSPYYHLYGGRGIKVCDRWNDFANFSEDMGKRPSKSHSLDRIDNDGDYEPSNCRWATAREQSKNRSNVIPVIRSDGVRFDTMAEAAESSGVHKTSIRSCIVGTNKTAGGYSWRRAND